MMTQNHFIKNFRNKISLTGNVTGLAKLFYKVCYDLIFPWIISDDLSKFVENIKKLGFNIHEQTIQFKDGNKQLLKCEIYFGTDGMYYICRMFFQPIPVKLPDEDKATLVLVFQGPPAIYNAAYQKVF